MLEVLILFHKFHAALVLYVVVPQEVVIRTVKSLPELLVAMGVLLASSRITRIRSVVPAAVGTQLSEVAEAGRLALSIVQEAPLLVEY